MIPGGAQTAIAELKVDLSLAVGDDTVEVETEVLQRVIDAFEAVSDICYKTLREAENPESGASGVVRSSLAATILREIDGK